MKKVSAGNGTPVNDLNAAIQTLGEAHRALRRVAGYECTAAEIEGVLRDLIDHRGKLLAQGEYCDDA